MNIRRALGIEGWTSREELKWLAEQASKRRLIAEIGSYKGRSTAALADNTSGSVLAVDSWNRPSTGDHPFPIDDAVMKEFINNMARGIIRFREESVTAARLFRVPTFDMIFIDGDHDYESVKQDILAWRPHLKDGGLLCGHDFWEPIFPGVVKAVRELISEPKTFETIWYTE